jgi:uncharacterized membrane protein YfcA
MDIYLPIAQMSVNALLILALGVVTGTLSGLFGVGGGFLTTPILIFIGIPPAVAVSSTANQIIAASFSGFLAQKRKQNVDFRIGVLLIIGGWIGSVLGTLLFGWLQKKGQIDLVISVLYVVLLSNIGILMVRESRPGRTKETKPFVPVSQYPRLRAWPMQMDFPASRLRISLLLPLGLGVFSGIMVALLGVGGGFYMIPAKIYLLGMPTTVAIGTSLFQIVFVTSLVTFMQSVTTHTVDMVLVFVMVIGSVIGAQYGTRIGTRIPPEKLRTWLAWLVLLIAARLFYGLFITPGDLYSIAVEQ